MKRYVRIAPKTVQVGDHVATAAWAELDLTPEDAARIEADPRLEVTAAPPQPGYRLTETATGEIWLDGAQVWRKTLQLTTAAAIASAGNQALGLLATLLPGATRLIGAETVDAQGVLAGLTYRNADGTLTLYNDRPGALAAATQLIITFWYTKG
ncbi:MAG: hypothetical protein LBF93_06700 [Zoogloeaceae bacterium]|jgi:hypothetical protein|nr:hypothetical protein [Zoogloeaceae bacterium]